MPVCLWGHALQEMRKSSIGASFLSARPLWEGKHRRPFHFTT